MMIDSEKWCARNGVKSHQTPEDGVSTDGSCDLLDWRYYISDLLASIYGMS